MPRRRVDLHEPRLRHSGPLQKRSKTGTIQGPCTDEIFMREYIKEWKRLMKTEHDIQVQRETTP